MRRVFALALGWIKARPPQRGRYVLPIELIQDVWAWDQQDRIEAFVAGYETARAEAAELVGRDLVDAKTYAHEYLPKMGDERA